VEAGTDSNLHFADLMVRVSLSGNAELVGRLLLGEPLRSPCLGDAGAHGLEELRIVAVHSRPRWNDTSHERGDSFHVPA